MIQGFLVSVSFAFVYPSLTTLLCAEAQQGSEAGILTQLLILHF